MDGLIKRRNTRVSLLCRFRSSPRLAKRGSRVLDNVRLNLGSHHSLLRKFRLHTTLLVKGGRGGAFQIIFEVAPWTKYYMQERKQTSISITTKQK